MRVEVRIGRLVVEWAGTGSGEAFAAALREELAALCAAGGTAGAWVPREVRSLVAAPAPAGGTGGARDAGRAVARSVHAALAPGARTDAGPATGSGGDRAGDGRGRS
ncbi:hypothetical protein ACFXAO_09245 [Streptomyces lavendulae]|uniref:hypothetical protein n=1 Tax=Streptomyces lavendulae TaxID=1914 RepID=UPI0036A7456E